MRETGVIREVKEDIITALQADPTLAKEEYYYSWLEVDTNTRKPCHSVDIEEETQIDGGCVGGLKDAYTAKGFIIDYIEPEMDKTKISGDLDNFRERTRNALKTADRDGTFTRITSWTYKRSYPRPWTVEFQGSLRILAHRMITEFDVEYEVTES